MKIKTGTTPDVSGTNLSRTLPPRESTASTASDSVARNAAPAADSIALSSNRDLVQMALGAPAGARADRVAELAQQYASGQYQVDAHAVSQALIAAHFTV